jgi:Ca-activated chloride channel family protein
MWKGLACYRAGNLPCAIAEFARLDTPDANFNMANALARQGEYQLAIDAYDRALAARPGLADASFNRALVAAAMKRPKPPEEQRAEAPDLPPDKVQFDDKGKQGKSARVPRSMAAVQTDAWLKSVQSDPGQFLRAKFAAEAKRGDANREKQ